MSITVRTIEPGRGERVKGHRSTTTASSYVPFVVEYDSSGLEILSVDECRRMLRTGGVGRLAWIGHEGAVIRPVNFVLDGARLVLRTGAGTIHRVATAGRRATLEIDGIRHVDHTAWSVIVTGTISRATDEAARSLPLRPWAPVAKEYFVQVSIDEISGRRIGAAR